MTWALRQCLARESCSLFLHDTQLHSMLVEHDLYVFLLFQICTCLEIVVTQRASVIPSGMVDLLDGQVQPQSCIHDHSQVEDLRIYYRLYIFAVVALSDSQLQPCEARLLSAFTLRYYRCKSRVLGIHLYWRFIYFYHFLPQLLLLLHRCMLGVVVFTLLSSHRASRSSGGNWGVTLFLLQFQFYSEPMRLGILMYHFEIQYFSIYAYAFTFRIILELLAYLYAILYHPCIFAYQMYAQAVCPDYAYMTSLSGFPGAWESGCDKLVSEPRLRRYPRITCRFFIEMG